MRLADGAPFRTGSEQSRDRKRAVVAEYATVFAKPCTKVGATAFFALESIAEANLGIAWQIALAERYGSEER